MTLAEAPMRVPLPPRQAPRARDHHTGSILVPAIALISWSMGIMVATKGILSMKAEAMADNHKIRYAVISSCPPVRFTAHSAKALITPVDFNPPTKVKRPTKKNMVGHSTCSKISSGSSLLISINSMAPIMATVADSMCNTP